MTLSRPEPSTESGAMTLTPMSHHPDATHLFTREQLEDVRMLFEYELCAECLGDLGDHKIVADPLGNPFAACLGEPEEDEGA